MEGNLIPLICPNCGGPLPSIAASAPQVQCGICSINLSRASQHFTKISGSPVRLRDQSEDDARAARRKEFNERVTGGIGAGEDPAAVMSAAFRDVHGLEAGEADVAARVTLGLVAEFYEDNGIDLSRDGQAMLRLGEAYLILTRELSQHDESELNLPFITSSASGPKHFARMVNIEDLQALSMGKRAPSRPPLPGEPQQVATEVAEEPPPKKRWWWPF